MRFEKFFDLDNGYTGISGLFFVSGDFGTVDGASAKKTVKNGNAYTLETDSVLLSAAFEECDNGAILRKDTLKNITDHPIRIYALSSRFMMEGYDYDVYTQYNAWQHENVENRQRLSTQVTVASLGIRPCQGAAPILGLYNRQNGKTTTFHLISNGKWKMNAARHPHYGKADIAVVETGFDNSGLSMTVEPNETVELPQVLFYDTDDRLSLGTDKMHAVYNKLFPRKKLPVMFNTWLCSFDTLDFDMLCRQVDVAADMGIEIFTVDAGWFGNGGRWYDCIGDWEENETGAFCGRMNEFSAYVRNKGMTFGLWIEAERALPTSKLATEHPEFLMQGAFMDFSRQDVREHLVRVISDLIDRYQIGAMKFDFNDSFANDPHQAAFYRYYEGQKRIIEEIRNRYPALYISGCAAGGHRTDLGQSRLFDSFWFTDNQGPREGLEIYKNAIKTVPPCVIEKWNVQTFLPNVPNYARQSKITLPVNCNNAVWTDIVRVTENYNKAFLCGGPIGFSCDLTAFPDDYKAEMTDFISKYKTERAFFIAANAKVICDTESFTAIEYYDSAMKRIKLHLFSRIIYQSAITVYPTVAEDAAYLVNGEKRTGRDILQNGITIPLNADIDHDCIAVELESV